MCLLLVDLTVYLNHALNHRRHVGRKDVIESDLDERVKSGLIDTDEAHVQYQSFILSAEVLT